MCMFLCVYLCIYLYVYICVYVCVYTYLYVLHVCVYMWIYMGVCICMYVFVFIYVNSHLKKKLKFQKVLDFSALLPVTSILTSLPQYTGSNTLKLDKITDLYVKFSGQM